MKSLVIYFSRPGDNWAVGYIEKGNTEVIAEYIGEYTGADLFKCDPKKPYSEDYTKCTQEAMAYKKRDARPELKSYLDDVSDYDVIYIGGPIYWGELPYEVYTELDRLDFSGKIVKPFATHEGSGLGSVESVLKRKCVGATVKRGLAIQGSSVRSSFAKSQVKAWVE
ncbi:MAG: flavodoxin [Clostridia bacterium]|nr:flavodoxin [Clostridia bacterium]